MSDNEKDQKNSFIWKSKVRAHEIDAQGIVNNAHYFCYFDNARTLHALQLGINWVDLSKKGFNIVLVHADIHFLHSLKPFEDFVVTSRMERKGRLKLVYHQEIVNEDKRKVCTGINTVAFVDTRGKPVACDQIPGLILN